MIRGEPREPGYRVEDWTWEAKRVRSSVKGGDLLTSQPQASAPGGVN